VVERDPIVLAKEVATLDRVSGGRFIFGVGGGWNAEEMAHHGTAFETRFELMAERIEARTRRGMEVHLRDRLAQRIEHAVDVWLLHRPRLHESVRALRNPKAGSQQVSAEASRHDLEDRRP